MVDVGARAFLMETYIPELDQAAATRAAASLSAATAALRAGGARIELLHSFALLGEEMFFSLFSATTLADVRTAGDLAQVGHEQLAEVVSYHPGHTRA